MYVPKMPKIWLALGFFISSLSFAQKNDSERIQDVCSYHEARVAFLLRCCGDTEIAYPGPRFPSYREGTARAAAALKETEVGLNRCEDHRSAQYVSLLLDKVGAELEAAAAIIEMGEQSSDLAESAAVHANQAARQLQIVLNLYPRVSVHLWPWFTHSLLRAGRPLDALRFLSSLGTGCCDKAALSRARGDVLFALKAESRAAKEYSSWLSLAKEHCGDEISLANVSYLRNKGFEIPATGVSLINDHAVCITTDDWHPYVRLSAQYMR